MYGYIYVHISTLTWHVSLGQQILISPYLQVESIYLYMWLYIIYLYTLARLRDTRVLARLRRTDCLALDISICTY